MTVLDHIDTTPDTWSDRDSQDPATPIHDPGPLADRSATGLALAELTRLIDDLHGAHGTGDHLRALSNLVAIQPLIGLLTSIKQQLIDTGQPADEHTNEDGGYL